MLFFMHLLIILSYKTMKLKSIWNELWKGSKLSWFHHFTHSMCKKYKGWWQKLDALRVQNRQSPSKYQGFIRKLVCYKGISFFWTYLNSIVFPCSRCTIQSHIIKFLTLSVFICYFSSIYWLFWAIRPWNWTSLQNELWKCRNLAWYHHFTHIACAKE